jgi:hypothetical protein
MQAAGAVRVPPGKDMAIGQEAGRPPGVVAKGKYPVPVVNRNLVVHPVVIYFTVHVIKTEEFKLRF